MFSTLIIVFHIMIGNSEAAILTVDPTDSLSYQTIDAALDSCQMNDTIILSEGTHNTISRTPFQPLTIMGEVSAGDRPRLICDEMLFREDVRFEYLCIDSSGFLLTGLQVTISNCKIDNSILGYELSQGIRIINNDFTNSAIEFYSVRPEIAFNTFIYDSLYVQRPALHYIDGPGVLTQINIHHNFFNNCWSVVEVSWPCQQPCEGNYTIDISDNWWGTIDTAAILELSGESEMGDIGDATVQYTMDSFLDAPAGSLGVVPDSVYGLSYNSFENISNAVVIGTFNADIQDHPEFNISLDVTGTAYMAISGNIVSEPLKGKGVYIKIQGNTVEKVLLLK